MARFAQGSGSPAVHTTKSSCMGSQAGFPRESDFFFTLEGNQGVYYMAKEIDHFKGRK